MQNEVKEAPRLAVIAAVQLPYVSDVEFDASLAELRDLAKTLGFKVVRTFTQKRTAFERTAYLGEGKRDELRRFVRNEPEADGEEEDSAEPPAAAAGGEAADAAASGHPAIEAVLVDHEISPSQARNLEKEVGAEVLDRTMVRVAE